MTKRHVGRRRIADSSRRPGLAGGHRPACVDRLESRMLLAGDVVISEFMAVNSRALADEDGSFEDWVELHNASAAPVNLEGWYLTDDEVQPTKWRFPAVTIQPGGYLLVFASNKDRRVPGATLHTNFKLDGDGEYLGLVQPDGVTVSHDYPRPYPPQEADVSYGIGQPAAVATGLVPVPADGRAHVPADGSLGDAWKQPDFDDLAWSPVRTGVGFEVGEQGTGRALPEEVEPNDTNTGSNDASGNFLPYAGATALYHQAIKGGIGSAGDLDFFALGQLQVNDVLTLAMSGEPSRRGTLPDSYLELYRANGNPAAPVLVAQNDDGGQGYDSRIQRFRVQESDTYFVKAKGYSDSSFYVGAYDLSAWLEDAPGSGAPATGGAPVNEVETNNTAASATNAASGWRPVQYRSSTTGVINAGPGVVDVFRYRFTAGDVVTVVVDSTSNFDASASLLNASGGVVALEAGNENDAPAADVNDAPVHAYRVPTTGDYFLQVRAANGSAGTYSADVYLFSSTPPPSASPFGGLIETDLESAMYGANASAFVRLPFQYSSAMAADRLTLSVKYDDGFVAYLNGTEVTRRLAPDGTPAWDAAAAGSRPDAQAAADETIDLSAHRGLLAEGRNVLAIHALNAAASDDDFLLAPRLESVTLPVVPPPSYFLNPTPGVANNTPVAQGPQVSQVGHAPLEPADAEDVLVTAKVSAGGGAAVSAVSLKFLVMFGMEVTRPMFDDGLHGDGAAGDGVYGGTIPNAAGSPGQMVRYYVTASDGAGRTTRVPLGSGAEAPRYFGYVVRSPQTDATPLPTIHIFAQSISAAMTRQGTRASVSHDGEFYDNVFIRDRGGNTSDGYKIDFNPGYHFRWSEDPGAARVDEINLNYNSNLDDTRLRAPLAFETFTNAGVPSLAAFPVRLQQNGGFSRMATFVENPDEEYLERVGLDSRGALYKAAYDHPGMRDPWAYEKKTRRTEGNADLASFLQGIHQVGPALVNYLYDNVDIPAFLTYWAANTIVNDNDDVQKNFYLYRDTMGDGEWQFLPWDKDLTFGKHWGLPDYNANDPQTHPFFGDSNHPKVDGPHAWNWLIDALLDVPAIKQMYLRRLRTLMDELLQPASTPAADRKFEQRIEELYTLVTGDAQVRSQMPALRNSLNNIRDLYLARRRAHLFTNHTNPEYPDSARIPGAQPARPNVDIIAVEYNPASGNQDQEYLQLRNPNGFAVDLSGWAFSDAIDYVLPAGTVIPANGSLYVARDLVAFRARTTGPRGGQGLLAVGGYDGQLSARGETVVLSDRGGVAVETYTFGGAPTAAQQALRVTEVMYHPHDAPNNTPLDENFEYVEVQNISGQTLDLAGLKFTRGFDLTLGPGTLAPGAYGLVVSNRAAFESRYGAAAAAKIIGVYTLDNLSNGGERIRVEDPAGEVVLDFHFDPAWYPSTDGLGRSLVIRDAGAPIATWGDKAAWRPSGRHGGSPGADDAADASAPAGDVTDVSPDPRTTPVDGVTITFTEPVVGLDLSDLLFTRNGLPVALAAPGQTLSSADGSTTWTVANLAALTAGGGRYVLSLKPEGHGIADFGGNALAGSLSETWEVLMPPARVIGRHLFYNNSAFDGRNPAADAGDDAAIATDKRALMPGQAASFANASGYSRGINGLMLDVLGLRDNVGAADFAFSVGSGAGDWSDAPAPASITRRPGAGANGSDRIVLTWPDGAIRNTWLRVTLLGSPRIGLGENEVFYFGNLVGETGDSAGRLAVNAVDYARTRANLFRSGLPVTNAFDHTRDGRVSVQDVVFARGNGTRRLGLFSAAPVTPPAPAARAEGEGLWEQLQSA